MSTWCFDCRAPLVSESGRRVWENIWGRACQVHVCLRCDGKRDARHERRRDATPPERIADRGLRLGRSPWENPHGYLAAYGLGGVWACWALRHGLLDEMFERPVTEADFGDAESEQLARRLPKHVEIEELA